jgi:hypothetical protein
MLGRQDVLSLNEARAVLFKLYVELGNREGDFWHGALCEACRQADVSIASVLIAAQSAGVGGITEADLHDVYKTS